MFNEIPSLQQLRDKEQTLFTNYLNFETDEVKQMRTHKPRDYEIIMKKHEEKSKQVMEGAAGEEQEAKLDSLQINL